MISKERYYGHAYKEHGVELSQGGDVDEKITALLSVHHLIGEDPVRAKCHKCK